METISGTYHIIRNRACIVCGADFSAPRVGKLYCSPRCKQFSYYHQKGIQDHFLKGKAKVNTPTVLYLKDYYQFCRLFNKLQERKKLMYRLNSQYLTLDEDGEKRLEQLENLIPEYIKSLNLPWLSLEEWSFICSKFSHLKQEDFLKLISSLKPDFFRALIYANPKSGRKSENLLSGYFQNHIKAIVEGLIKFK